MTITAPPHNNGWITPLLTNMKVPKKIDATSWSTGQDMAYWPGLGWISTNSPLPLPEGTTSLAAGECMPDSRAGCRRLCPNRTDAVPTPTAEGCFMSCQGKHKTRKRSGDVFKVKWFDNIRYRLHHPTSSFYLFYLPTILTLSLDPRLRRIRIEHSVPMVPSVAMQPLELCSSRRIQANLGTIGMTVVWQWDPCSAFSVSPHLACQINGQVILCPHRESHGIWSSGSRTTALGIQGAVRWP